MLNVAMIGCGRISHKHVKAILENQNYIRLVAVSDIIIERAAAVFDQYGLNHKHGASPNVYVNYKDMINKERIDIITICTESGYHAEIAIYCMNQGKHVIVEKPMALSTSDAELMIEAAKTNQIKLCVSHQNRFNPPIQKLRGALEQGRFGRIIAGNARVLWNRGEDYYSQALWRGTYELDGGCLMNQCIHNIDLLQWMLGGEISWVNGEVGNYIHPYIEAEDYGSIQIKFDNGAIGNVEGTVCIFRSNLEETLTIIGENGIVSIGGLAVNKVETWRFKDNLDSEDCIIKECNEDVDSVYGNGHSFLYKDMIDAIYNNREPYINGREGIKAMEIILAAYQSSKAGSRVRFPVPNIASRDFK